MKLVTSSLPGVRVVRQEPWECLCSFICSSNNNVKRIALILNQLKRRYGKYIATLVCTDEEEGWCVISDAEGAASRAEKASLDNTTPSKSSPRKNTIDLYSVTG